MTSLKISLLTNMVTPYRVPFFKAMASAENISSFRVLTCVDKESDREWTVNNDQAYQVKRLLGITLNLNAGKDARRIMHFRFGILWELIRHRPDKLIIGDASWTSFIAAFICQLLRIPYVVWNEITTTSKVSKGIVAKLRNYMYCHATHLIASCEMAREYLNQCGVSSSKISIVNNAVDNEVFLTHKAELEPQRDNIRERLGIAADAFCFVYVGQLISRKRVIETLELLATASKQTKLHFIVAGTGPLEQEMRSRASELGFTNINFCGFVQGQALSELYVAADSLILLSEDEPWGMVVNEAIIFDCNVFSTIEVAAAVELSSFFAISTVNYDHEINNKILNFISSAIYQANSNAFILKNSPQNMAYAFLRILE
jgi:glycosyltransferase involved in cell wall biosynthesis